MPVFWSKKVLRSYFPGAKKQPRHWTVIQRANRSPSCQFLPHFHIVPPKTPKEWMGRWVTIDF